MSALNDPAIVAIRATLTAKVGAAGARALELHDTLLASERMNAADDVERFGAMLRLLSTEEGAAEALQALAGEPVRATFAHPWAQERSKRGVKPRPQDVELATGTFTEPFAKPAIGAMGRPEIQTRGRVTITRLAKGGIELRTNEAFSLGGEGTVKPSLVFSARRDLEEGPDAADLVLPESIYYRHGAMRIMLPGELDASRRWLHVVERNAMKLSAELRFTLAAAPEVQPAQQPVQQQVKRAPKVGDVVELDDDDNEIGGAA